MKYKRVWFFGGDKRLEPDGYVPSEDDFVTAYIAENGKRIECRYGFYSISRWYEVDGKQFYTLKEAKGYIEKEGGKENEGRTR